MHIMSDVILNQISSSSIEDITKLEFFTKLLISFLIISTISLVFSNFDKLLALIIAIFPFVAYFGCEYLLFGLTKIFIFPFVLCIPVMYLVIIYIIEFLSGKKHMLVPILSWSRFYKIDRVYTVLAIILFAYLMSESHLTYKANQLFADKNTFIYHLLNLIFINYLISGISLLCIFIDKRLGMLFSIFPIFLQICYDFQLNGGKQLLTSLPWNYFLAPLFISIILLKNLTNNLKKY